MKPTSNRPELPGTYSNPERAAQGTGLMFGTVLRVRLVRNRRTFDVRTEAGEVYAGCDALAGGPRNGVAWQGMRVALGLTDAGRVIVLGPTGEGNDTFTRETASYEEADEHPGQFGNEDHVVEHNGIRLVFGAKPNDLLIEVPGVLRIAATSLRFSKNGATGAKVVMWGPLVSWGTDVVARVNALDAWAVAEGIARPLAHPTAPAAPYTGGAVEPPTAAMASGTVSIPEESAE